MAERLLVARLREPVGSSPTDIVEVSSAGTHALAGRPMEPEAVVCLERRCADAQGFVGRQLTMDMIERADLILTATRGHRAAIVTAVPRAVRRTLTILEMARLLTSVDPIDVDRRVEMHDGHRLEALVSIALSNRGMTPLREPTDDDITDPYRQPLAAFEEVAERMDAALSRITSLLRS
jgi:protein-tyrosine phosphatase